MSDVPKKRLCAASYKPQIVIRCMKYLLGKKGVNPLQFIIWMTLYIYYCFTIREVPPEFHERMMKTVEMCGNQERIRQAWEEVLNEKQMKQMSKKNPD